MSVAASRVPAGRSPAIEHPLPADYGFCVVVHGFLSDAECRALIATGEAAGFRGAGTDYPPSYRDNDRLVVDDAPLATRLLERLEQRIAADAALVSIRRRDDWELIGVNERLRFCRYRAGTQFGLHQDGVHHRGDGVQSRLTFMVYLNDAGFEGGDTVFFRSRAAAAASGIRFRPRAGSLIVFDHGLWHAGDVVTAGCKYILRSDLLFRRACTQPASGPFEPAHRGYVWTLAPLADGRLASAGRDASIRLWDAAGSPRGVLLGHTRSVLGLVETRPGELVSVSRDRCVRRWTLATGESTVVGTMDSAVLSLARIDDERVVTGDADGRTAWWNLRTGASFVRDAHACWTWAIATLPDGRLASASEDGTVKLWTRDGDGGETVFAGGHPLRSVDAVDRGADGARLAIGDADGGVHLLEVGARTPACTLAAHQGAVRRVRFAAPDVLYSCGEDGRVLRWDLATRRGTVVGEHDNFATDVIARADGSVVSAGYDGRIRAAGHGSMPTAFPASASGT